MRSTDQGPRLSAEAPSASGSLREAAPGPLRKVVEGFAWAVNPSPSPLTDGCILNLGCGETVVPGLVNIDFLPHSKDVLPWDLLNRWPDAIAGRVAHAFSEDLLEHFFFDEQAYILAQMNLVLRAEGVFRVLMPALDSLLRVGHSFDPIANPEEYLARHHGVRTGADAINLGMRFGGHRWLHDAESLQILAALCGFQARRTTCAESGVPQLSGINVRDETNSLSFAHDLRKDARLVRWCMEPRNVVNAVPAGELVPGQPLYRAVGNDPQVLYELPSPLGSDRIVVIAVRGANLSQFREHNFSELHLVPEADAVLPIDTSMASCRHSSFVAAPLIRAKLPGRRVERIRHDPGREPGDMFTVGPAEVFFRE